MYHTKTVGYDRTGEMFNIPSVQGQGVTLYNPSGSTIAKGQPVMWEVVGVTAGTKDHALAIVTSAETGHIRRMVAFAMADVLTLTIGKFQFSGLAEVLMLDTGNIAAARHVELANALAYAIDNGTSLTKNSAGILVDAVVADENSGSPVLKTVSLRGERIFIAAA